MTSIDIYINAIEKEVLPKAQQKLRACATAKDISTWRSELCSAIYQRKVTGDLDLDWNPQDLNPEEQKDDIKFSERVLIEARRLEDDHRMTLEKCVADMAKLRDK